MTTYRLDPPPIAERGDIIVGDPGRRATDRVLLGRLTESGPRRQLWLDVTGEQVVGIFGKRGTGKSYTMGVLIEGLSAGASPTTISALQTPRGALVFDIMDIFWSSQIPLSENGPPQIKKQYAAMQRSGFSNVPVNIDVWLPAGHERPKIDPPGLNRFQMRPQDLALDDWAALFAVDIYGEPRGMLIAETIQHVSQRGYTTTAGITVPANPSFTLQDILKCLAEDADLLQNYQDTTLRSITQRMATYASLPLFNGTGTPLNQIVRPFRTSIMMMGRLTDALKKVVVAVLLRAILRERGDASFAQKRLDLDGALPREEKTRLTQFVSGSIPRCWVLMDEAHVLAGRTETSVASEALIKYAKEGRNYGLSLAVATQQPSALDPRLTSQVETIIAHQLTSPEDALVAAKSMRSPEPREIDVDGERCDMVGLLRRIGQGETIFSCANAPALLRSCVTAVRPRLTAHGGYEA